MGIFDRHGNLFVAIVSWDYDHGWMCEEWHNGEYEENHVGGYGDCEECRRAALREGLEIAKRRNGRVLHHYESPEVIAAKRRSYKACDQTFFMLDCSCALNDLYR